MFDERDKLLELNLDEAIILLEILTTFRLNNLNNITPYVKELLSSLISGLQGIIDSSR